MQRPCRCSPGRSASSMVEFTESLSRTLLVPQKRIARDVNGFMTLCRRDLAALRPCKFWSRHFAAASLCSTMAVMAHKKAETVPSKLRTVLQPPPAARNRHCPRTGPFGAANGNGQADVGGPSAPDTGEALHGQHQSFITSELAATRSLGCKSSQSICSSNCIARGGD